METSNANQSNRTNDPVWHFLAEFPLSELLLDRDSGYGLTTGSLFQTMRELGIPLAYLEKIDMTLKRFAKEALTHFQQGSLEWSERIRVFCPKKMIDGADSPNTSRLTNAKPAMEHGQIIYPPAAKMNGGWGYYVIERGRDFASVPGEESCRVIELYVYKEGK